MSALTDALVAAQAELPTAIERDSQGYGYRYTSLDKLLSVVRPILTKHGIAISQYPAAQSVGQELRPCLVTAVLCGDERYEYWTPLYITDKTMQGFGTAITYARRYALASLLCIASEEDTDAATVDPNDDVPF